MYSAVSFRKGVFPGCSTCDTFSSHYYRVAFQYIQYSDILVTRTISYSKKIYATHPTVSAGMYSGLRMYLYDTALHNKCDIYCCDVVCTTQNRSLGKVHHTLIYATFCTETSVSIPYGEHVHTQSLSQT